VETGSPAEQYAIDKEYRYELVESATAEKERPVAGCRPVIRKTGIQRAGKGNDMGGSHIAAHRH
jgi:hypothetical protein